jgi:protein TonB
MVVYQGELKSEPRPNIASDQSSSTRLDEIRPNLVSEGFATGNDADLEGVLALPEAPPILSPARLEGGKLLRRVEPHYPELAKKAALQGAVVLDAIISPEGKVRDIQVVSGTPMLADAAVNAVSRWQYQPFEVDGRAVAMATRVTVLFRLAGNRN